MKRIIILISFITLFIGCKKSDETSPTPVAPSGVTIKTITQVYFQLPNASGAPTRMYVQNSNTAETVFSYDVRPTGIYSLRFSGLGGHVLTGTPRSGATNTVAFDAGIGDTLILMKNGVETIRAILANDNLNVLNGGIFVERLGLETNAQAGGRINAYSTGVMLTQKWE